MPALPPAHLPLVVIADPNADVLQSTALLVRTLGYEALPVSQPAEVLATIEAERPGLVLVETQFPGLNLSGLVAALRSNEQTADIPLAFFSSSKDLSPAATRHKVWGVLAKPFTIRELALVLQRALGPSPAMREEGAARNIERDVRAAFHDYRNALTALGNYLAILDRTPELGEGPRQAVSRLVELAGKLENKTEHLRAYVLSLMLPNAAPDGLPADAA